MAIDKPEQDLAEGAEQFRQWRQNGVEQMLTGCALSALTGYAFLVFDGGHHPRPQFGYSLLRQQNAPVQRCPQAGPAPRANHLILKELFWRYLNFFRFIPGYIKQPEMGFTISL